MRFTGIVLGFAALGVVLFSRISTFVTTALPALDETARAGFIRDIASGDLSGAGVASTSSVVPPALALQAFSQGYVTVFATSAVFCLIAAILTWRLVRASDTQPIAKKQRRVPNTLAASTALGEARDRA
jgi:hypothetical protein